MRALKTVGIAVDCLLFWVMLVVFLPIILFAGITMIIFCIKLGITWKELKYGLLEVALYSVMPWKLYEVRKKI